MHYNFDLKKPDPFDVLGTAILFKFASRGPNEEQQNGYININGDYSDASEGVTDFKITAMPGFFYTINRILVSVRDSGSFDSGSYGNGITLINGINIINGATINGTPIEYNITEPHPIKVNPDWGTYCYDSNISSYGSGNEQLNARWTLAHSGRPVILDGDIEEYIAVRVNDDLSGLVGQWIQAQGLISVKSTKF